MNRRAGAHLLCFQWVTPRLRMIAAFPIVELDESSRRIDMRTVDVATLKAIVAERGREGRSITAIAGPPGAGKSTLAESLAAALEADEPGSRHSGTVTGDGAQRLQPRPRHASGGASGVSSLLSRLPLGSRSQRRQRQRTLPTRGPAPRCLSCPCQRPRIGFRALCNRPETAPTRFFQTSSICARCSPVRSATRKRSWSFS